MFLWKTVSWHDDSLWLVSHHYPVIEACSFGNCRHAADERSSIQHSAQKSGSHSKASHQIFFHIMYDVSNRSGSSTEITRQVLHAKNHKMLDGERKGSLWLFAEANNSRKANPWWFLLNKKSKAEEREFLCRQSERRSRFKIKII